MTHQTGTPTGEPEFGSVPHSYDPELTPEAPMTGDVVSDVDYAASDATSDAASYRTGQQYRAGADISAGDGADTGSTADTVKDQAAQVKDTAVEAGKDVAGTTKQEVANVVAEAQDQAKSMLHTLTSEVREQAGTQQQRGAGALHALAKELGSMASSSSESGPLTDLAHEASRKGGEIAHWLENREPSDVLDEVKRFARRRPVAFLLLCGTAGVLAGRLTRGAIASNTSLDSKDASSSARPLEVQPVTSVVGQYPPAPATSSTFVEAGPGSTVPYADPYAAPATTIDPAGSPEGFRGVADPRPGMSQPDTRTGDAR